MSTATSCVCSALVTTGVLQFALSPLPVGFAASGPDVAPVLVSRFQVTSVPANREDRFQVTTGMSVHLRSRVLVL